MDTKLKIIENDKVDEWITSLYSKDAKFEVEFEGAALQFNKRIPMGVMFEITKLETDEEQTCKLIAILSSQPKFTMAQAMKLPQDLLDILTKEFKKILPKADVEGKN